MNRRASLPGADELFRASESPDTVRRGSGETGPAGQPSTDPPSLRPRSPAASSPGPAASPSGVPEASGRVRHDQKITVYLTAQELLDLEQARLHLRAEFDIAVDRGRIVREAVAALLQEMHDRGPDSAIVRRLS